MTLTYEWKIIEIEKAPSLNALSDVVVSVNYKYTGTDSDSGHSNEYYGRTSIGAPDASNFVPLANLTENQVSSWVEAVLSEETEVDTSSKLEIIKTEIINNINEIITPTKLKRQQLPWAPAEDI
jgi:hypothetical protein